MQTHPPKRALKLLRWFCREDYLEEIEGDLLEIFQLQAAENPKRAKRRFNWNVVKYFRPEFIKSFKGIQQINQLDMFKNNFKIASRHLLKHKFYALINILGLAIGMTCCMLIFLYVHHELSYDSFHAKEDRIYRLVTDMKSPTETQRTYVTSAPMAAYMKNEFPEVENMVRLDDARILLARGDQSFQEDEAMFADGTFFDVFTFNLILGNQETVMADPFSIILTENAAKKYFGDESPIGKTMQMEGGYDLTVTGIMQNVPENSNFTFDVLLPLSIPLEKLYPKRAEQWESFGYQSYVLLSKNANPSELVSKLPEFLKTHIEMDDMSYSLFLEPLKDVYLHSERGGPKTGSVTNVIVFSVIAGFILLIACFNFMNLSTARATERAKEVGIRKVVGAQKSQLVIQFLSESIIISAFALVLALLSGQLLLPAFNFLSGKEVASSVFGNTDQVLVFCAIGLAIGLSAGIYPSFFLSKFRAVTTLKGKFSSSKNGLLLRKVLVVTQFAVSIILITGTLVVYKQLNYMRSQSLGFKKDQMLIINFYGDNAVRQKVESFKQQLTNNPGVISVSASSSVPGELNYVAYTELENPSGELQSSNMNLFYVDHDFIDQYEMEVTAGRAFSPDFPSDSAALMINEAAAASYGYGSPEQAIGKRFDQWGVEGQIIGVVKDYHFRTLQEKIEPLTIRLEPKKNAQYLTLNLSSDDITSTVAAIGKQWKLLAPQRPFEYFFLDEQFDQKYRAEERFGQLFIYFAGLAIFIACLGLLGLISYTVVQRTKEIGIRKVFGAGKMGLVGLLSRDVLLLVFMAFVPAIPIAWMSLDKWLENFAFRIELNIWTFVLAGLLALAVTFLTISFHTFKAALANPIDSLRNE